MKTMEERINEELKALQEENAQLKADAEYLAIMAGVDLYE